MVKVFLFHRVSPQEDKLWPPISPRNFERIIRYIQRAFVLIPLSGLKDAQALRSARTPAVITFDDGYKDFIEYALPILKKYRVPSSCFVITDCTEKGVPPWTYALDYKFQHSAKSALSLNDEFLPEELKRPQWKNNLEKIHYAQKLKLFLKEQNNKHRMELCHQFNLAFDDIGLPQDMLMTWNEIRQIASDGVAIGSHTHTHPLLDKVESAEEIYRELEVSKNILQREVGQDIDVVSYPNGSYDHRVVEVAQQLGYQLGLAVEERSYHPSVVTHFDIPRISLFDESVLKTKLRTHEVIQRVKKIRNKLK